ncbi:cupin domain-containing protein [Aureimonas sp. ME7]|uniref:cupin domain-containing protein n=1 Tax=Aureimonas sp. ME7 TaxID=2744252 RepID=UPI001AEE5E57|nr:cupin domain-containing protein [Aureimonas sp. ME7]
MSMQASDLVRTFHDLRRFAAEAPRAAQPANGDAFIAARRPLVLADAPTHVFAVDLPAGSGEAAALPADEFVIVLSSEVLLTPKGEATRHIRPNESFVLVKGTRFTWSAPRDAVLIVLSYPAGGGNGALHAVDPQAERAPSASPSATLLVGETPKCRSHQDYLSEDGTFVCGTWEATPYVRKTMLYRHCELMHLLKGSVTFVDEGGHEATFRAGDVFFVEAGAACSWESREDVAKVYAIHRPA